MTTRTPYFASNDRAQLLLNQLHEWRGTRWQHAGTRPNEMKCGVTGDCLFWVHAFKAIGALPATLQIPDYRLMEASADKMSTLRAKMIATGRADLVWQRHSAQHYQAAGATDPHAALGLPWLLVGDVLIFTNGTSGAHCGLVVRACPIHFTHLTGNGLNEEPLNQSHYLRDFRFVYRLLEELPA